MLSSISFLIFATALVLGQLGDQSKPSALPNEPKTLVKSLYTQVVARHPVGLPKGADMEFFAPYLSNTLLHRIDLVDACGADWYRQNPDPSLKPDIGWLELGLFSGGEEETTPSTFIIERAQSEKDGSIRVYVKLTYEEPHAKPFIWHVAAIVLRQNDHYVVDDVIYLKEPWENAGGRLSARLSANCDGPHWVGLVDRKNNTKQPIDGIWQSRFQAGCFLLSASRSRLTC
jgi:hypothetical protein